MLKLSYFSEFLVENCLEMLLMVFKMCQNVFYITVLFSSYQQKVQSLKSIHFWMN